MEGWTTGGCRNIVTESGVICFVYEHMKEGSGLFVGIRLGLGLDLDNESRNHCGEKVDLFRLKLVSQSNNWQTKFTQIYQDIHDIKSNNYSEKENNWKLTIMPT